MASKFHSSMVWRRTRQAYLNENPLCVMCKEDGRLTAATVVDHIKTVRDRPDLSLEWSNFQSLCKFHHDSTKQMIDHGKVVGCDVDGNPTDPRHPWHGG